MEKFFVNVQLYTCKMAIPDIRSMAWWVLRGSLVNLSARSASRTICSRGNEKERREIRR